MHRRTLFTGIFGILFSSSGCLSQISGDTKEQPRIQKILLQNKGSEKRVLKIEIATNGNQTLSNSYRLEAGEGKEISGQLLQTTGKSSYEEITITVWIRESNEKRKVTVSKPGCSSVIVEVTNGTLTIYTSDVAENSSC